MGYEINIKHTQSTHHTAHAHRAHIQWHVYMRIFSFYFWCLFSFFISVLFVLLPTTPTYCIVCRWILFFFCFTKIKKIISILNVSVFVFIMANFSYWNYNEWECNGRNGMSVCTKWYALLITTKTQKLQVLHSVRTVCEVSFRNNWKSQNKLFSCFGVSECLPFAMSSNRYRHFYFSFFSSHNNTH